MQQINQSKSGTGKQRNQRKLKDDKWYILLIKRNYADTLVIKYFKKFEFPNPQSAQAFINTTKEFKDLFLVKMKGKKILEYGIRPTKVRGSWIDIRLTYIDKYPYAPERITFQDKKSFRTTYRRQMRDYGKSIQSKFY